MLCFPFSQAPFISTTIWQAATGHGGKTVQGEEASIHSILQRQGSSQENGNGRGCQGDDNTGLGGLCEVVQIHGEPAPLLNTTMYTLIKQLNTIRPLTKEKY